MQLLKSNWGNAPVVHVGSVSPSCAWGQCRRMCGVGVPIMHAGPVSLSCVWGWCPHHVCGVSVAVVPVGLVPPGAGGGCCWQPQGWRWAGGGICNARKSMHGESWGCHRGLGVMVQQWGQGT